MSNLPWKSRTNHWRMKILIHVSFSFCAFLLTCFFTHHAYAHKVSIYAYAEDGKVHSESYFIDGTKCKNAKVVVFDEKDGTKLLEGTTNDNGQFSFIIPKVTSMKLVLHASIGHQNDYVISEDEVREAFELKDKTLERNEEQKTESSKTATPIKKEDAFSGTHLSSSDISEIEAIVEKVTDRKLQPVLRMLMKLQEKSERPSLTEIIGGIGYIIGILGIVMYLKSRSIVKNSRSKRND